MCQQQTTDVLDTDRLEKFKKKRDEWLLLLNGDDPHSIRNQQSSLLWDYALFLTVNELRKVAARNPVMGVGFNAPVLRLFDAGFAVTQATGIRRLAEKQWKDRSNHVITSKRVISLRALVDDIRENRELLTREVYLGVHALPFDPVPAKKRCFDRIAASGQKFFYEGMDTRGSEAWAESERAHEQFDKLSEKSPSSRSREDVVSPRWFDLSDAKIKSCEDVCLLTDKFIAHAADPVSRAGLKEEQTNLSLSQLAECHQSMLQVAGVVSGPLLQDSMGSGLPTPQFDLLEHFDKAWASEGALEVARERWRQLADQIEKWSETTLTES